MKFLSKLTSLLLIAALFIPLTACNTDTVLSDIDLGLQTANVICQTFGTVNANDAAACQVFATIGTNGINSIKSVYDDYKSTGAVTDLAKIKALADSVKGQLSAELQAAHITNTNEVAKVTAWVNLIDTTIDTIVNLTGEINGHSVDVKNLALINVRVVHPKVVGMPTPESMQARWEIEVCKSDETCKQLTHPRHVSNSKTGRLGQKTLHVLTFGIK